MLRALDTIEDDMTINVEEKVDLLTHFHERLVQVGWTYNGSQSIVDLLAKHHKG